MTRALPKPWALVSLEHNKWEIIKNIRNYRNQLKVERKQQNLMTKGNFNNNLRVVFWGFVVQTEYYWREDKIFNSKFFPVKTLSQLRSRLVSKGRMPKGKTTADWYMSMCNLLFQWRAIFLLKVACSPNSAFFDQKSNWDGERREDGRKQTIMCK